MLYYYIYQVTMQAKNDAESRYLHDQLAILAPLFLALSASTPIFKGRLAGTYVPVLANFSIFANFANFGPFFF